MNIPDYISEFPIPSKYIPAKLKELLSIEGTDIDKDIEVTLYQSNDEYGLNYEHVQMLMAVVPSDQLDKIAVFNEAGDGVLSSAPFDDEAGGCRSFKPNLSGFEYVVAAHGDGSFYGYILSENVWVTMGLTPRCEGNDSQKIIFDDLRKPKFSVASGEASNEYFYSSSRDVSWKMNNSYLRKFLWLKDCCGVRVFFYEKRIPKCDDLINLMVGDEEQYFDFKETWCEVALREIEDGLLIQVWASVIAVTPEKLPSPNIDSFKWPDFKCTISKQFARDPRNSLLYVYLKDNFLEKYEQNNLYDTIPSIQEGMVLCSPSYKGQWNFVRCRRYGRNFIKIPLPDLYQGIPINELQHANKYAVSKEFVEQYDQNQENIVLKTNRYLKEFLKLGDNLTSLSKSLGIEKTTQDIIGINRSELEYSGWESIPRFVRLSQVAPLNMSQQQFLERCKLMHEIWQSVPDGVLKKILERSGCPKEEIKKFKSLKLMQCLLNVLQYLNSQQEPISSFESVDAIDGWRDKNLDMSPLFKLADLRNLSAHESRTEIFDILRYFKLDTSSLNEGYGIALDTVFDGVIETFEKINSEFYKLKNCRY